MVGDQFGDVRLRIKESRDLMRELKVAVEQSKLLVIEARAWLDEHRATMRLCQSDRHGEATPF